MQVNQIWPPSPQPPPLKNLWVLTDITERTHTAMSEGGQRHSQMSASSDCSSHHPTLWRSEKAFRVLLACRRYREAAASLQTLIGSARDVNKSSTELKDRSICWWVLSRQRWRNAGHTRSSTATLLIVLLYDLMESDRESQDALEGRMISWGKKIPKDGTYGHYFRCFFFCVCLVFFPDSD